MNELSREGGGSDAITVLGGRGGFTASLDDLIAAMLWLRECSDRLAEISRRTHRLDMLTGAVTRTAPVDALARVDWHRSGLVHDLGGLAIGLDRHAWQTRKVITTYRLTEWEAAAELAAARVTVPLLLHERWKAQVFGLFRDGRAGPVESLPVDPDSAVQLWDLASIVTSQSLLSGTSTVRVIQQSRPGGGSAWVVQIPGTVTWNPRAGEVPNDLTADLQLMARRQAVLAEGAIAALAAAQEEAGRSGVGDPVMLTGHSLGGLTAASIASDASARERFHITHVVTVGSPVGYIPVPDDIEVLSLEHSGDFVPDLDLVANPDRETWTTVHRESQFADHGAISYRETARLASEAIEQGSEPSLVRWAATAAPFLRASPGPVSAGGATPREGQRVRDYRVRRASRKD